MPRVSVIISTYNRARWLPATLDSVLAQKYSDREVIVVDDGSTDDTRHVLARYSDRITAIYQPNSERGAARNRGLAAAAGEFVAFLDSDDLWSPDKLGAEVTHLDRQPADGLVYSDAVYVDDDGRYIGRVRAHRHDGDVLDHIVRKNFIPFGAHLARRELIVAAGGFREDRALAGSEDWEMWTRIAARTRFGCTHQPMLRYRIHAGGTVASPDAMARSMWCAHEIIFGNPDIAPRIARHRAAAAAYIELVTASLWYSRGDRREALRHLREAFRTRRACVFDRSFVALSLRLLANQSLIDLARKARRGRAH